MLEQLQEMPPEQFEHLVGQLLKLMDYEIILTQYSHDGGVDIIATHSSHLTIQRVLVQVKRYRGAVGLSIVRELYGALASDPLATTAVLVTTGSFSTPAQDFAIGKRISLIDGPRLVQLFTAHCLVGSASGALVDVPVVQDAVELVKRYHVGERHFAGAYLRWAGLQSANLSGADVSQACLSEANLRAAILNGAKLSRADLK